MVNRQKIFPIIVLICLTLLTISCASKSDDVFLEHAITIKNALNDKDIDSLAELIGSSLTIREQHWEAMEGESNLVLVTKSDSKISSTANNQKGLQLLAETIFIEGDQPKVRSNKEKLYVNELQGIEHNWSSLVIVEFSSEQERMEHLVLFGFDPSTQKLLAIYSN